MFSIAYNIMKPSKSKKYLRNHVAGETCYYTNFVCCLSISFYANVKSISSKSEKKPNKPQNTTQPRPVLSTVTAVYTAINDRCKDKGSLHWQQKSQARKTMCRNLILIEGSQRATAKSNLSIYHRFIFGLLLDTFRGQIPLSWRVPPLM